ncbi:Clp protease ClpP [Flavobacterium sp. Sr18]|uniref:Clp protease ClpP n=1 Tax=Flavobacterium sp. Sr18 TaxID=935222 RepID=UPI0013E4C931|nr:Clp protease ClpP [Flavobacterium sp. Sr18]QIH37880.1 Clp protease ClpP [Flavobacterium sp. Sr18]
MIVLLFYMIGTIYITGEIGFDTTLLDVIKQVKNQSTSESFLVKIDSVGGYVDAGMDIYNYLKNLSVPVTTYTTKAYSIASVIFMAGSTRIIPENAFEALMIHLPWMEAVGNHSELSTYLKDLKNTEDNLVKFYSDALALDTTTIHSLLKSETYLSATQAKDLGFATQLQVAQKAVARLNNNKEEIEESLMNKLNKKIDSIMNMLSGNPTIKAELKLQDATGVELVFADLDPTEVASVDAKVMVDGKAADGDFLMADGSTITAVKGVVTVIAPAEEVEVPVEEEAVAVEEVPVEEEVITDEKDVMITELEAKVAELEAKIAELMSVTDVENLLNALEVSATKQAELETKFLALAKSIGSDFTGTSTKENQSGIKNVQSETTSFAIKRK